MFELIESITDGNSGHAFNMLSEIEELAPEYDSILKDIIAILHKVSIHQALENSTDNRVIDIAKKIDKEFCQLLYEIAINSYSKFSVHPNPREALELCLLRMLTFNPLQKLSENSTNHSPEKIEKKNLKKNKKKSHEIQNHKESEAPLNLNKFKNNQEWIKYFNSLKLSQFVKNIFGTMSFISFEKDELSLMSHKHLPKDINENWLFEFKEALKTSFSKEITVKIKEGEVEETPFSYNIKKDEEAIGKSKSEIENDKDIQSFLKKFNAKIKDNTIKPIK